MLAMEQKRKCIKCLQEKALCLFPVNNKKHTCFICLRAQAAAKSGKPAGAVWNKRSGAPLPEYRGSTEYKKYLNARIQARNVFTPGKWPSKFNGNH